jgi:hypothetical protein
MDVSEGRGPACFVFGEERVTESTLKTCPVGNGEYFECNSDRIRKGNSGGNFSFLKQGTESERESGGRDIFNFRKQNRGKR